MLCHTHVIHAAVNGNVSEGACECDGQEPLTTTSRAYVYVHDSLVHWQYGKRPTYQVLADRMIPGVPSEQAPSSRVHRIEQVPPLVLSVFIFYSRHTQLSP